MIEPGPGAATARLPLTAAAGQTWRLRIEDGSAVMQLAVVDPRSGAVAARSWRAAEGLRWTAPETGIWRLEARADSRSNPRAITVVAAREADRGGSRAQPERIAPAGAQPRLREA